MIAGDGRGDIIKSVLTNTKVREKTMTITMLRVMIALGIVGMPSTCTATGS